MQVQSHDDLSFRQLMYVDSEQFSTLDVKNNFTLERFCKMYSLHPFLFVEVKKLPQAPYNPMHKSDVILVDKVSPCICT